MNNLELKTKGFLKLEYPYMDDILPFLQTKNWQLLDLYLKSETQQNGKIFSFLRNYLDFNSLEYMIAIRSAPDDEDGIWHDDGSRLMAFSLSLNLNPDSIKGGELLFKRKNSDELITLKPAPQGIMYIFLTGFFGFEHKVNQVIQGERIVIAGWCSQL